MGRERGGINTGQWQEWDSEGTWRVGSCQGGEEAALRDEEDQEKEQVGDMGASRYPTVRKFTSFQSATLLCWDLVPLYPEFMRIFSKMPAPSL